MKILTALLLCSFQYQHATKSAEFEARQSVVVVIKDSRILMSEGQRSTVMRAQFTGAILLIEKIEGRRLLFRDISWTGWADSAFVADFDRGMQILSELIRAGRATPRIYHGRGKIFMLRGAYQDVVNDLSEAIRMSPRDATHHLNRGICHLHLQRFDDARADFTFCIRHLDDSADVRKRSSVYFHRGLTYYCENNWARAIADFSTAIDIEPNHVLALNRGAMDLRQLKQPAQALADYDRAIAISPDFIVPHNYRGHLLQDLGRYGEATQAFEKAIALVPENIFVLGTISHSLCHPISTRHADTPDEYGKL